MELLRSLWVIFYKGSGDLADLARRVSRSSSAFAGFARAYGDLVALFDRFLLRPRLPLHRGFAWCMLSGAWRRRVLGFGYVSS